LAVQLQKAIVQVIGPEHCAMAERCSAAACWLLIRKKEFTRRLKSPIRRAHAFNTNCTFHHSPAPDLSGQKLRLPDERL